MSTITLLHATAALSWIAFCFRLPALRRSPAASPTRAYGGVLFSVAVALTLLLPEIYSAVGRATQVPNLALLLANASTIATCWAVQLYLLRVSYVGDVLRVRWASALFVAVLVALVALFALAPLDREARDFTGTYGDAPFVLEYRAVFLAYLGLSAGALARSAWRWGGRAATILRGTTSSLPLGLRLVAIGGCAGLGYVANELARMVLPRIARNYPLPAPNTISQVLVIAAVTLMVLGSLLPAWRARFRLGALRAWVTRYSEYRQLFPLWLALYRAVPRIALAPTASVRAELQALIDLPFRRRRRAVEIRDGIVALSPYLDADVAALAERHTRAAALPPDEALVAINAAVVAVAIHSYPTGLRAERRTNLPLTTGGGDIAGEIAYLARLARAFRYSPVVRATVQQFTVRDARGRAREGLRGDV